MKESDLGKAGIGVILAFQFLQFFEERRARGDKLAIELYEEFFKQEYPGIALERSIKQPVLFWETTLSILPILFSYAKNSIDELQNIGFSYKNSYGIEYVSNGKTVDNPDVEQIIHTMRNALAHFPDFVRGECDPNIVYGGSDFYVSFISKDLRTSAEYKASFYDEDGFLEFLSDFMRSMKKVVAPTLRASHV